MKAKSPYLEELRGSMKQGNDGITARMDKKGEIVIEKIPTHYDADTDLQETQRQAFKSAIAQWNALSDQEKEEWREKASPYGLTGYQYFMQTQLLAREYEITLYPTDNAFIYEYTPNDNRYPDERLLVDTRSGTRCRTVLKFDLSEIPSSANIETASLKLYYYSYTGNKPTGRNYDIHRLLGDWTEETITWNNCPSYDTTPSSTVAMPSSYGWVVWDITEVLQKIVSGEYDNYGWLLKDRNDGTSTQYRGIFYSKEQTANDYDPRLYIKYQV